MAIIWQQKHGDKLYQVRTAGASRRLYTNNVCHSQYNPKHIITGSIWDLLSLPAFFHSTGNIQRVLVLGVGGGVVLKQFQAFFSPKFIQGVELDEMHLTIAKRFFGLQHDTIYLDQADASSWVANYSGPPFDVIVEDLFTESLGQPVRALAANSIWFQQLLSILDREGVLIMNFASKVEFRNSAIFRQKTINHKFRSIFQLTLPTLDNYVGVYLRRKAESSELHFKINSHDLLKHALQTKKLRYRIRKQRRL